ncbi:atrophin-1 [Colletotrichum asianum]
MAQAAATGKAAAAEAKADPSAVASMSRSGQDAASAPGGDKANANDTASRTSDQAPLAATIRPPATAATTPETGALHHPHHQPTPHATATETAATPDPAATTPAAVTITTSPVTATGPGASLAHPDIIKQAPCSQPDLLPSMPVSSSPPPSSSLAAPEANTQPKSQPQHTTAASSSSTTKMIFSDIYKSPRSPLAKFRHSMSQQPLTLDLPDYDPDLLSKDKVKQKEAVKKYLASKIRNDWEFVWPPVIPPPKHNGDAEAAPKPTPAPATQADAPVQAPVEQDQETAEPKPAATQTATNDDDVAVESMDSSDEDEEEGGFSDSDAESVYSTVSEDPARFKPRLEWVSDLSDEDPVPLSLSPFRFDSPDAIGAAVKASVAEKRAARRRALREEMQWNEGLACFEARRNAWTGARTVRVRAKPVSPTQTFSPLSPRRLFFRSSMSQPSPAPLGASPSSPPHSLQQRPSNDASAVVSDGSELTKELTASKSKESARSAASAAAVTYPVETLIPLPAPLLPPGNPMRASITPSVYISLYEKVIVHALTPSCPVNLSDMIRACVVGWKRDGEWPPKPAADVGIVAVRRRKKSATEGAGQNAVRRMSFGFLGRAEKTEGHDEAGTGKGIRRSLQRVLGLGQHHPATGAGNGNGAANGKEATAA